MGFSANWLDLREPVDHAARDVTLLTRAAQCVGENQTILDLGSGTGSTARAFHGTLASGVWRFLDSDTKLLEIAGKRHPNSEQICANLKDIDALPLDGAGLVTASALLDLMPLDWIEALARRLKSAGVPLYAALNYNGEMSWTPSLSDDATITAAFNAHQLTDKGIGAAAGPNSAPATKEIFERHGFDVMTADSPWTFGQEHSALHDELLAGIASAAAEAGHQSAEQWLGARRAMLSASSAQIGHTDVLAVPR